MPITIGSQTIGGAGGGVPTTRTIAGLDLSQDRSAAAMKTALAIASSDVSGLGANGSGTYAARPATPAAGDTYLVTSGQRMGSLYHCRVAGQWLLVDIKTGLADSAIYDVENVPASGSLRWWPPVRSNRNAAPATVVSGYVGPWVLNGSLGGMSALGFGATVAEANTFLRADALAAGLGSDKSIVLALSGWNTGVNNGVIALGSAASTAASVGIFTCFPGSGYADVGVEYEGGATSFYRSGNTVTVGSGIHTIIWTWDSGASTSRLYIDGAPAATPTQVPTAPRGVLARQSVLTIGAGRTSLGGTFDGKLHGIAIVDSRLSDANAAAFHTFYAARFS